MISASVELSEMAMEGERERGRERMISYMNIYMNMYDPMMFFTIATSLGTCMINMAITIVMDRTITILDNKDDDNHGYQIIVISVRNPLP